MNLLDAPLGLRTAEAIFPKKYVNSIPTVFESFPVVFWVIGGYEMRFSGNIEPRVLR